MGGTRVLRAVENPDAALREQSKRLVRCRRLVADDARAEPCEGIADHAGRPYSPAQHEVPDQEFFGGEVFCNPLVHSFVTPAH